MRILPAVTLAVFGLASAAAQAGEAVLLDAGQMDRVVAGVVAGQPLDTNFSGTLLRFNWPESTTGAGSLELVEAAVAAVLGAAVPPPPNGVSNSAASAVSSAP